MKKGFTLAETLITIVIIGIVAALTVPTMITKYQKEQTATRLKKAYSALSQANTRAIAEYGQMAYWEFENTTKFADKYITPYLNLLKQTTIKSTNTWDDTFYYLNGTPIHFGKVRFYMSDGISVTADIVANTNTEKQVQILIDINGDRKPNKIGKDVFPFYYIMEYPDNSLKGKFLPDGYWFSREDLASDKNYMCNKNQMGTTCSALIMKDGWQIKDDYPW